MKHLLPCLLTGFVSLSAFATPKVGDFARYHLTASVDGKVLYDGEMTKRYVDYNEETGDYLMESTNDGNFDFGAKTYVTQPSEKLWVAPEDIYTAEDIADYLDQCGTINRPGKLGSLELKDHAVRYCEQPMSTGGVTRIGEVPFTYVFYEYAYDFEGHRYAIRQQILEASRP